MLFLNWILTLAQVSTVLTARLWIRRTETNPYPKDGLAGRDPYRKKYSNVSEIQDPHREGYQLLTAPTSFASPTVLRTFPPPFGYNRTSCNTTTTDREVPIQTNTVPKATAIPESPEPDETPSDPSTMGPTATTSNIFGAPIATTPPASSFQVQKDHPVPRKGISGPTPIGTNKFYANFFLGNQTSPTYVHPYSLVWARGQGAASSWGLAISHIEANQRVYGDISNETGAAKYFLNPAGIQSLALSAMELGSKTALTTDNLSAHSVNVNLHVNSTSNPLITFPLVQGMGFVTAVYKGGIPVINTGIYFKTVTKSIRGPKPGVTKYTLYLEDGKVWHVYAYSAKGDPFDLTVVNNKMARANKTFDGIVQVAKDPGNAESVIDGSAGAYPMNVTLSGSVSGSKGSYTFQFQKAGISNSTLLMYALPHHVDCFDDATNKSVSTAKLQTTTKGVASGVVADSWTMVEPHMPVSMGFAPWDPVEGEKKTLQSSAISTISAAAINETSQDVDQQSNQNSMYFSGKVLS